MSSAATPSFHRLHIEDCLFSQLLTSNRFWKWVLHIGEKPTNHQARLSTTTSPLTLSSNSATIHEVSVQPCRSDVASSSAFRSRLQPADWALQMQSTEDFGEQMG